ncbi:gamma-secretase subunit Aph-1-like [Uranotaenia lowii]|uniref:gamma-secretase subunit Aph-1-like n=1 Tax=Uranotaenia lowii TaxID=190385 RepID=UPI0024797CC6|nr:gamma-secretase subunit Aph-1-like [Uranotaenia lowii]
MTIAEFLGCLFLAFGPSLAMFTLTIAHDPQRISLMLAGSFFWLVSLLFSTMIWFMVVPLRNKLVIALIFSVFIQLGEGFRYLLYKLLRKIEPFLHYRPNRHISEYVTGLGFGTASGVFSMIHILPASLGPATVGLKTGSSYLFVFNAAQSLCMILLHTFWNVIFFSAWDTKNYSHITYVVVSHLFVSCVTLLNSQGLVAVTLTGSYLVLLVTTVLAFRAAGGTFAWFWQFITNFRRRTTGYQPLD